MTTVHLTRKKEILWISTDERKGQSEPRFHVWVLDPGDYFTCVESET